MFYDELLAFAVESNKIEGIINRDDVHAGALKTLLKRSSLTAGDIITFVAAIEPGARLRDKPGMNVVVGNYYPPPGGPEVKVRLEALLDAVSTNAATPYRLHVEYETLHAFLDGNGRSGRAVWLWQKDKFSTYWPELGFLRSWYYSSLGESRGGN